MILTNLLVPMPKLTKENVVRQFWLDFVEDEVDVHNAIQTKAQFSHAMTVMDRIGGWEEETWVGSRFAACMWRCWKEVI